MRINKLWVYDHVPWMNPASNQVQNSEISWAYWAWDSQVDGGYGLWHSGANRLAGDGGVASTFGDLAAQFTNTNCSG